MSHGKAKQKNVVLVSAFNILTRVEENIKFVADSSTAVCYLNL